MAEWLDQKVEFVKGVGPQRAALLQTELSVFTFGDLLHYFPFRYEDKTKFYSIGEIHEGLGSVQVRGKIKSFQMVGTGKKRLVAMVADSTGILELVWFQGANYAIKKLEIGKEVIVYGKPSLFGTKLSVSHPEIESITEYKGASGFEPVYSLTERMRNSFFDNKALAKCIRTLLEHPEVKFTENLPVTLLKEYSLVSKTLAMRAIHFPADAQALKQALFRLKFEELFYIQIRMLLSREMRRKEWQGFQFNSSTRITEFYNHHLPFELTDAQKKVLREIYKDVNSGKQMNRLLQGDVGSGKTIVAFICMLMAIGVDTQACLMAPTEILATQHYQALRVFADKMNIGIALLTGSTKKRERDIIHAGLKANEVKIIIGTHALLEETVQFHQLGLAIVDEQHRFGVAQRARLWQKNEKIPPHVLVMTATPIPRTLAMTLYGDLDISVIDQLPQGRKPIKTLHRNERHRLQLFGFLRQQIELGRQVYIVYPLIEESEKVSLKDLMDGYESICRAFPEFATSIVHGKMTAEAKSYEMNRFLKNETKIMVATTVIEVGVNVPNATVMVIENAERFGLSQLHQLRGRVGRGGDQSYCVLMTADRLSQDSQVRIETMVRTTNGFEIADVDLKLRGPGDLSGTRQSGALELKLADLSEDALLIQQTRAAAGMLIENDPALRSADNACVRQHLMKYYKAQFDWAKIS
ncbi:MAG: ATP-dependent DNA helicase RecG [Cytophagaceae bacterium]|jgi:ATP-dependent DNA helicase RecG|nr:ATP-dependent DNA helicase RecG [Cytophagaceae bacterium]